MSFLLMLFSSLTAGSLHVQTNLRDAAEEKLGQQVTHESLPPPACCRRADINGARLRRLLSVVSRLLELLTAQLLQSSGGAPSGLQFHVLDLYMTELAAVGSTEVLRTSRQSHFLSRTFFA